MEMKLNRAMRLRGEGYNCAQAVLIPFSEELGIGEDTLAVLTAGLGGGAGQGELCGVANALAIAEGVILHDSTPEGKKRAVAGASRMGKEFSKPYGGCITCRDLKGKCGKTCHELVGEGVKLLFKRLEYED